MQGNGNSPHGRTRAFLATASRGGISPWRFEKAGGNFHPAGQQPSTINRPVFHQNVYQRLTLSHSSYISRWSCYGATHRQMH